MRDRRPKLAPPRALCAIALALALLLTGCAGTKEKSAPRRPPVALAAKPAPVVIAPKPAPVGLAAQKHMAAGAYQAAIDDYDAEFNRRSQDRALVSRYVKSIEDIKASADKAGDRSEFAAAGKSYDLLLKNFPKFTPFAATLTFDEAQLGAKLTRCRKALATRGFQEYRQGNLDQAIALWRSLLAIDPANAEIKTALGTAILQQKNLRQGASGR